MTKSDYQRPLTTQETVLAELRRRIISREISPGEPIRLDHLAMELEVSTNPVREALRVLVAEGVVVHEAHRGYFAASLSRAELEEVYRLRELLESFAVSRAIQKIDDEGYERLELLGKELEALDPATDMVAFISGNRNFHFAIFEAAESPPLTHLISLLWSWTDQYRALYYAHESNVIEALQGHRAILAAVQSHNVDAAIEAHQAHRQASVESLSKLLDA